MKQDIDTIQAFAPIYKAARDGVDAANLFNRCTDEILNEYVSTMRSAKAFIGEHTMRDEYMLRQAIYTQGLR